MFRKSYNAIACHARSGAPLSIRRVVVAFGLPLMLPLLGAGAPSELVVRVTNVRNGHGLVHVDVCPQNAFLKEDCPYAADVAARSGTTEVVVRGVPPGRYAVQAYHDENANHRVDRGLFGIPREGIGFSNDAPISFGPPTWARAEFEYRGGVQQINVTMRYFTGASGPGKG
jgi:uncharacterized protein (DUF2141 family)